MPSAFQSSLWGGETVQVVTTFVHPVSEGSEELSTRDVPVSDDSRWPAEWLNDPMMDRLLSDCVLADTSWPSF